MERSKWGQRAGKSLQGNNERDHGGETEKGNGVVLCQAWMSHVVCCLNGYICAVEMKCYFLVVV